MVTGNYVCLIIAHHVIVGFIFIYPSLSLFFLEVLILFKLPRAISGLKQHLRIDKQIHL